MFGGLTMVIVMYWFGGLGFATKLQASGLGLVGMLVCGFGVGRVVRAEGFGSYTCVV